MAIAAKGLLTASTSGWTHTTSAASYTGTTSTTTVAVGDIAIVVLAADNTSTVDGDNGELISITDTGGNTWQKLAEYTNSPTGVAGDGVTVSCWYTKATTQLNTGATLTFTYGSARVDKCGIGQAFTIGSGLVVKQVAGTGVQNSEVNAANGFGSSSYASLASAARLYLRAVAKEASSTGFLTATTNFTAWGTRGNGTGIVARAEHRINTSTGETSNPTFNVSGDSAGVFLALEEATAGVVGTSAKTLDDLTGAATGVQSGPVGTSAVTLAAVTVAATATSTITGTAAATLAALTVVAAGAAPAVATLTRTLDALTLTAAGTVVNASVGTAALTLADLTAAATATAPVVGTSAPTLAALLLTSAGAVPTTATGASLLADLTVAASATATISGAAALTLAALTASAAGQVPGLGAGAATLAALTMTATGMVGATPVLGTASLTLGALTISAQGHGPGIFFVSSSDGQGISSVATAALPVTAGNCLVIAIGKRPSTVTITGVTDTAGNTYTRRFAATNTTSQSLGVEVWTSQASCLGHAANVVTVAASGSPQKLGAVQGQYEGVAGFGVGNESFNSGSAGGHPADDIAVSAHSSYGVMAACVSGAGSFSPFFGTIRDTAQTTSGPDADNHTTLLVDNTNADSVLNEVIPSGSAGHWAAVSIELLFNAQAVLSQTLGALTLAATGTAPAAGATGTLSATLADVAATATGKVTVGGALAATLADVAVAAVATSAIRGTAAPTLDALTAVGAGAVKVTGSTTKTLDAVTVVAAGSVASPATGTLSKTLAPLTLVGTITPTAGAGGTLARTLDALTVTAAATTTVRGAGAATLAPLTCAATGIQFGPAHGLLAVGLDNLTMLATGTAVVPPRPPVPAAVLRGRLGVPVGPSLRHPILVGPDARRKHHLTFSGAGAVRPRLNVGPRPRAQRSILTGRH